MDWMYLFGFAGIFFVNVAYLPQFYKTIKLRKTWQISPIFYLMIATGICFYEVYAIYQQDLVFIISNAIGLIQPLGMAYLAFAWRNR